MRRPIASVGVSAVLAGVVILGLTASAPASVASGCQPPTAKTSSGSTTASTSSIPTTPVTTSPPTIPDPSGHPLNNNTVENCADGTAGARSKLQVAAAHGADGDPVNLAYAYAHDCSTGCQAVAAAYQVVLEDQNAKSQTPQNVALAVTYRCDHCGVFAYADQYVVDVPPGTHLSSTTQRQLAAIQREADRDVKTDLTFSDLDAKLRALARRLSTEVDNGLQAQHRRPTHEASNQHLKIDGKR